MKRFLVTSVALFILWQLAYKLYMQPSGIPDRALTQITGQASVKVLSLFYDEASGLYDGYKFHIHINGQKTLGIAPYCNGLELMALYVGVLIALPGGARSKIVFSFVGVAGIFLLNIARCCLLVWLHSGNIQLYHFAHHYAFKLVIYFAAFLGWVLYAKQNPIMPKVIGAKRQEEL
jgi:exosortase/archaeosortase family protein